MTRKRQLPPSARKTLSFEFSIEEVVVLSIDHESIGYCDRVTGALDRLAGV
jgi:hypothetical protein